MHICVVAVAARRGKTFLPSSYHHSQTKLMLCFCWCAISFLCCSHFLGEFINTRGVQVWSLNQLSLLTEVGGQIHWTLIFTNPQRLLAESFVDGQRVSIEWWLTDTSKDIAIFYGNPIVQEAVEKSTRSGLRVVKIRNLWSQRKTSLQVIWILWSVNNIHLARKVIANYQIPLKIPPARL